VSASSEHCPAAPLLIVAASDSETVMASPRALRRTDSRAGITTRSKNVAYMFSSSFSSVGTSSIPDSNRLVA